MQNLASIQPRTSPVKFARSPRTDPPGSEGGNGWGSLDDQRIYRGQKVVAAVAAFFFFVQIFGAGKRTMSIRDPSYAVHVLTVHGSIVCVGFTALVWLGLMPSSFDFNKHLAVDLIDIYNGWTFYNLRYALTFPFQLSNILYAGMFFNRGALVSCPILEVRFSAVSKTNFAMPYAFMQVCSIFKICNVDTLLQRLEPRICSFPTFS